MFSNHFLVNYKKAQRHRVINLCGVALQPVKEPMLSLLESMGSLTG